MPVRAKRQDRLAKLSEICLALPGTAREDKMGHSIFLVGRKVFAYYLNNHHGDNIVSVCCKVLTGDNQRLVDGNPRKFYLPAYIGPRGWVGLRLDLPSVDWTEVKEIVCGSYAQTAPKSSSRSFEPQRARNNEFLSVYRKLSRTTKVED